MTEATVSTIEEYVPCDKSRLAVLCDLVKVRLTTLVLLTTVVGFYVGAGDGMNLGILTNALLGTALLAWGAAALNQLWEREWDGRMVRTADRPLPSGRMRPDTVLALGVGTSVLGLGWLAATVNPLTCFLGAITLTSYLFVYTPLKRLTPLNTAVGAIPGALPPLMGWTAATGEFSIEGWALFAILFFWQLPHFLAIGWMYRDDYAKAGFAMLPVIDKEGKRTGGQTVSHTMGLLAISLFPTLLGLAGRVYFFGALALGIVFVIAAIRFASQLSIRRARQLFLISIVYLPLLLGLMVFDKV